MRVVSRKVIANDIVPAGAPDQTSSGFTPFPSPPTVLPDNGGLSWHVYLESKCALSASMVLVNVIEPDHPAAPPEPDPEPPALPPAPAPEPPAIPPLPTAPPAAPPLPV